MILNQAKVLLGIHGDLRPQPSSDWTGPFALPPSLASYYQDIGPSEVTVENYGNPFFFPSLAKLWTFQAGYRWNARTGDTIVEWEDDWIVVDHQGGDPLIFSCATGRVLIAEHGTGSWEPGELLPDLTTMAACIGAMGKVVVEAGESFTDDDGYIDARFRQAAESSLTHILGSQNRAEDLLVSLGWG